MLMELNMAEEKKQEFWRWTESNWKNSDIDWKAARYITVGIDVGSISSQAVIMADGKISAYANMRTGSDSPNSARNTFKYALEATDMPEDRMDYCVGTGYGRVNVPFADRTITEIACHARGANFIYGNGVRTVLDVGGQDIKAIQCDKKGKVSNFLMNDKCAAGTGRGMEVFADLLGVPINDVGDRSFEFKGEAPAAVSNTCVVYAKSEATGLLRKGWSIEEHGRTDLRADRTPGRQSRVCGYRRNGEKSRGYGSPDAHGWTRAHANRMGYPDSRRCRCCAVWAEAMSER
jgi:bzd-type benzoyl-CoA reductase Q subunit